MKQIVLSRIKQILLLDTTSVRWVIGWVALIGAFGFIFGTSHNENYKLLMQSWSGQIWGVAFLIYGVNTIATCVFRQPNIINYLTDALGMWLWSYLFLSFVVFDTTPTAATEYMLIIPLFAEVWILADRLSSNTVKRGRRKGEMI